MSVTSSFFTIHSNWDIDVEPKALSLFPFSTSSDSIPKLLKAYVPISPYFLNSWTLMALGAATRRGSPAVCDTGKFLPVFLYFSAITSTRSYPIFLKVVHFPPIRLSIPLGLYSMTWLLAISFVFLDTSSATSGRIPLHLALWLSMKSPGSIWLMMPIKLLLINSLSFSEQVGLLVGSSKGY